MAYMEGIFWSELIDGIQRLEQSAQKPGAVTLQRTPGLLTAIAELQLVAYLRHDSGSIHHNKHAFLQICHLIGGCTLGSVSALFAQRRAMVIFGFGSI